MKTHCLLALAFAFAPLALKASGSYHARPPRPPSPVEITKGVEKERYELGKKIYSGKARLTAQPAVDTAKPQEERLKKLQARLPESARKKTNLPALAGRLTPAEMDALEYYVNKRYPVKY